MKTNDNLTITEVEDDKKQYLPLLLIGDESETMIDRYLDSGTLYVGLFNGKPIAVCVTVNLDSNTLEIKNLAVDAEYRRHGYGRRMLEYVESRHSNKKIILGTGETPSTLKFYKSCGYSYSHRIPNFFIDNYSAPIIEEGVTLRDMIYLEKQ
ncbi:MAG: GNAT family N-acetyltransferase [Duncaniella sp.]|nr:GNAT family N-acetyltransferase [Duncaniella sp.]